MQLTMAWTRPQRPILVAVSMALLLAALVAATMFIGSQRRQGPPSPFRNGAIVFEQDGDLFIADEVDGTPRALVAGPEADSDPVFSAQGDRVAFVRQSPDGTKVMAVRPDGADVTELATVHGVVTAGLGPGRHPLSWSPDGRTLLASSLREW